MNSQRANNDANTLSYLSAKVTQVQDEKYLVWSSQGIICASLATSCLIKPQSGDTVAILQEQQCYYIVSILHSVHAKQTLNLSSSAQIHASESLTLSSPNINLLASKKYHVFSADISIVGILQTYIANSIKLTSTHIRFSADSIKTDAKSCINTISRCVSFYKDLIKKVTRTEHNHAGSMLTHVTQNNISQASNIVVNAKKDVKVNGERIHMG